jgi:predicted nucleic acid-binding protein
VIIVSNSGPLIALAAISRFDLLRQVYGTLLVPQEVYQEVVVRGAGQPGSTEVQQATWITVEPVQNPQEALRLQQQQSLQPGESEAIILAEEQQASWLLVDDFKARRVAQQRGRKVIGSVGILLLAKQRGFIPHVRPLLDAMRAAGVYIAPSLYQHVLYLAGK